jgi:Folliculin-interacting protein N-terminus
MDQLSFCLITQHINILCFLMIFVCFFPPFIFSPHQFPFHKNQVRVLLYRDCDWRGRRLLFDSSAIECIEVPSKLDNQMVAKKTQHVLNKTSTKSSNCSSSSSCSTPQSQHVEYVEGCAYKVRSNPSIF